MQLISALVCVTLMSVAQAISLPNKFYPKPKVASQNNSEIQEERTLKLPEERRNIALFPRMNKKFVVTPEPLRVVSQPTKKPLMKKLVFRYKSPDDQNTGIESATTQSIMTTKLNENYDKVSKDLDHLVNDKEIDVSQNLHQINDKESSVEIATEDFEDIQTANEPMIEENIEIEEFILNPTEEYVEDLRQKWLLQADNVKMNDTANTIADSKEFIFLNPLKQAEKDFNRVETTEKYVTIAAETDMPRVKRSDNIIEEENLGTTVSGYKFTWWDTTLTNNLAFKNINS